PKGLELTVEAESGLESLRSGFLKFEESVQAMRAGQSSKALTIAAPRDISARWLAPQLAAIAVADAELRFTLIAADAPLDFTEANLDLALRWMEGAPDLESLALDDGRMVPIGPPSGDGPFRLIWSAEDAAVAGDERPIMRVSDAGLALDSVMNGLGVAIVPLLLAWTDIAAGRVRQLGDGHIGPARYWLVAPTPQWRQHKVRALVAALNEQSPNVDLIE
ncbi:MAG: LysR substrate-binding domain-containing protein, partial [Sphingopyxis sp.]